MGVNSTSPLPLSTSTPLAKILPLLIIKYCRTPIHNPLGYCEFQISIVIKTKSLEKLTKHGSGLLNRKWQLILVSLLSFCNTINLMILCTMKMRLLF